MLHLVSLLTENYVPRALPFLNSLSNFAGLGRAIVCLGFDPESHGLNTGYRSLSFYTMPRHWSESSLGILQHGRWADALPEFHDDDVYLLSDADIIVQRPMYPGEHDLFTNCPADMFLAGWNAFGPGELHVNGDNLLLEAERIGLTENCNDYSEKHLAFGTPASWGKIPCFNTGILAMRGITWKRLRDLYESRCERFYKLTSHRSRGQWLMNYCLHRLGLKANVLPLTVHSHGHMGIPKGVTLRDGTACYHNEVILFRHAM